MPVPEWFPALNSFVGYGSPNPQIIFIGLEEGGKANQGKTKTRQNFAPILNLLSAVNELREANGQAPLEALPNNVSTWRRLSKVLDAAFGNGGQGYHPNFGTAQSNHLLTEMLPLPKSDERDWPQYYQDGFKAAGIAINDAPAYRDWYFASPWWTARKAMLRGFCAMPCTRVVIVYTNNDDYRAKLFDDVSFHRVRIPTQYRVFQGIVACKPVVIVPHVTSVRRHADWNPIRAHLAGVIQAALHPPHNA